MTELTLNIRTENAAFCDDRDDATQEDHDSAARAELARILRDAAKHLENGSDGRSLHDSNGNKVGQFDIY